MERRRTPASADGAAPIARASGLALVAASACAGLAVRAGQLVVELDELGVDQLVELLVVAAGALVAGWFALSSAVATACLVARRVGQGWHTGEQLVARLAPVLVRRALALTVAAGIGLGTAVAADAATADPSPMPVASQSAAPADLGWPLSAPTGPAAALSPGADPGSLAADPGSPGATPSVPATSATTGPARPTSTPIPSRVETAEAAAVGGAPTGPAQNVVVRHGDCLWDIARRFLPAGASDAAIAAAWPAWYETNRVTIGPDPDLILPGQVLTVPRASA